MAIISVADLWLIRHGQSNFNLEHRFTGGLDVPLTRLGMAEAQAAALKLVSYQIDIAFTSTLQRASDTLMIILAARPPPPIPILRNNALNERDYGLLQGQYKDDVIKQYGETQVNSWRRGYLDRPPCGESLQQTESRVMPYFRQTVGPKLVQNLNVLVVAHGNSLRALVKNLNAISDNDISKLEIATGSIYQYQFDSGLNILSKPL